MKHGSLEPSTDLLRRYLLGELDSGEGGIKGSGLELIEEKLFSDESFLDRLSVVEDDLIDEYLRDQLPRRERESFERTLPQSPRRRERLEAARAIHTGLFGEARRESRWKWRFVFSAPAPQLALAASLIALIIAAGGSLVIAERQSNANRAIAAALRELEGARAELKRLEARSNPTELSFALSPGLIRAETGGRRLAIPPGNYVVRLQLSMESKRSFSQYRAVVEQVGGKEVWSENLPQATSAGPNQTVTVIVPSIILPPSDYILILRGSAASGYVDVADFAFRVVRP